MKPLKKLNEGYNSGKQNNEPNNINSTDVLSSSISMMNNEQSIVANQSGDVEQASVPPKDATTHSQRTDVQKLQNVLIWLDNNIDENSAECRNSITQLRQTVNDINMFTDAEECMHFIDNITDIKAYMIITGSIGQDILPHIHPMSQVDSIFIFSDDKEYHEQWAKEWPKIKGVFTEMSSICEALQQATDQCEQNGIPISFAATDGDDVSKKNLDQLDPIFMYSQILKEILLTIEFNDGHIKQFIDHCRTVFSENDVQLNKVNELETKYHTRTPIWWYTCESFLYPMLNRALRLMDMDIIIKMGFFITDLHRHIEQLHSEQFSGNNSSQIFTVYRGHGISKTEFDQMTKIQGGLMSFNNFLSTNKDRQVSLAFAQNALPNRDMVGILFVMTIDPNKSTIPFASITDVGYFGDREDEVLFSMHTVFRIDEIIPMDESSRLFQVSLTLISDNDNDLRVLTDRIREETYPDAEGWFRLGLLLLKMGESAKAQQVYEILLEQTTDMDEKAAIYHQLGSAKDAQGEYNEAITFYEKALEIYKNTLSPTDLSMANCYNNIGEVYRKMDDYSKALSYYEKAFEIRKQTLPSNHPDLGASYNNIGLVYSNMGDYSKALSYYEKAFEIRKQSLPSNHPDLGASYNNIGEVYFNMGDYPKALSYCEKALEIQQQSLPSNHSDLGPSYNNIGNVYFNIGNYPKALSYYEKGLEILKQSFSSNHPDLGTSYNNLGIIYKNMGDYPKAFSYYEKALEIRKKSLSSNHPHLGASYNNIGSLYGQTGEYAKALSYYEKALEIWKQSIPSNHISLGTSYNNIGMVYYSMGDYPKALLSYEKALEIQQKSLPSNHPDLGNSYDTIGEIYCKIGEYSKALAFCEKAVAIQEQVLPENDPGLCICYSNIGEVYENMGDYSKAHSFYERAMKIAQHSLPADDPDLEVYKQNLNRVERNCDF